MNLKFCGCKACRRGRKSKWNQVMINNMKGGARRKVKQMLKKGKWEDAPTHISVPYTD